MTAFLRNASIVHPCSPQDASCQPQLTQKEGNSRGTQGDTTEKSWLCMVMPLCLLAQNKEKSRGWGEKEMEKESKRSQREDLMGLDGTWWDMIRHDKRVHLRTDGAKSGLAPHQVNPRAQSSLRTHRVAAADCVSRKRFFGVVGPWNILKLWHYGLETAIVSLIFADSAKHPQAPKLLISVD